MTLFSCSGLSKAYFEKSLFEDIAFGIDEGQRIGIIGRNGAGKTSLLRIVAGLDEPDAGSLARNREARFEYLTQAPTFDVDQGPLSAVVEAYDQRHGHLEDWEIEVRAKQYLGRLGIHHIGGNVRTLSGGQRKRVALARALMAEPDLLILDEPTNHLDAASVQWLQEELSSSPRALLLVTHDRYFLDAVCDHILELDQRRVFWYEGSYEKYLERKEAFLAVQDATAAHQRNKLRTELAWLAKGAKARRTKQKSRIDWIAQMQAQPERTEQRDIEIEVGARFLGGKIIDADGLRTSIDGRTLFTDVTWRAKPGDRIGIIGPNGAGKSTLLATLAGRRPPDAGYVSIGETVTIGYFEQEIKDLNENATVIANVRDVAEYIDTGVGRERYISAKELCDRFDFSSKQQHAFVHTLSGGERRRLALLRVLMANPNVLFLDEPTNDFDLATLSALEEYLQYFKGVLLVVSHDRAFLDKTVDTIWCFEEGGRVKEYPGNYSAYLEAIERNTTASTTKDTTQQQPPRTVHASTPAKLSYKERKEYESLEQRIAELEERKHQLEHNLNGHITDYTLIAEQSKELEDIIHAIDHATVRWLELAERA
jgi:ATP-binding cassette subfamily F protein uup